MLSGLPNSSRIKASLLPQWFPINADLNLNWCFFHLCAVILFWPHLLSTWLVSFFNYSDMFSILLPLCFTILVRSLLFWFTYKYNSVLRNVSENMWDQQRWLSKPNMTLWANNVYWLPPIVLYFCYTLWHSIEVYKPIDVNRVVKKTTQT